MGWQLSTPGIAQSDSFLWPGSYQRVACAGRGATSIPQTDEPTAAEVKSLDPHTIMGDESLHKKVTSSRLPWWPMSLLLGRFGCPSPRFHAHSPWAPVRIHRVDSTRIAEAGTLPGRQTLRALTGTAQWTPLGPARALPDRQEDRLAPHEDNERRGFSMGFMSRAKLLCLTRKLRASANKKLAYVSRNAG